MTTMQYRRTGRSGLLLPAISLGLWHNFGGVDNFENGLAMGAPGLRSGHHPLRPGQQLWPAAGKARETNFGEILRRTLPPIAMR